MKHSRSELFRLFRYICVNNKWKKFFGQSKKELISMHGPGILRLIDQQYDEIIEEMESKGDNSSRRSYGGTNMTNYRLRQMATYGITPDEDNFNNIGSF